MVRVRFAVTFAFASLLLGALGCGPTLYQPSGKLTKGGAGFPTKLGEKGMVKITLYEESDSNFANPQAVTPEKDGTFKVVGTGGKGVPAGKYRASVEVFDPYEASDPKDVLGGSMAREKGPIIEVKDSKTEIVIEVK